MSLAGENITRKKIYLILIIFFLLVIFNLLSYFNVSDYNRVKIFILDDFSQDKDSYGNLSISHGELVRDVIREINTDSELFLHNINSGSGIKEELYLEGLAAARDYKLANPKQEVIVNVSLSFSGHTSKHKRYINSAIDAGVVIIAAAGNDDSTTPIYPAGFSDVIAVANAQRISKAKSSNYGKYIDLSAPGEAGGITTGGLSQGFGFSYVRTDGTSFSAPRVVATLAQILELDRQLSSEQALELIINNTSRIFAQQYQAGKLGSGLLNQSRVLRQVDFTYWLMEQLPVLTLLFFLLIAAIWMLYKYKITAIFFIIIAVVFLLPASLLLSENLAEILYLSYNSLIDFGFNTTLLVVIFLAGLTMVNFSYWLVKLKLLLLFVLIVCNLILINYQLAVKLNYLVIAVIVSFSLLLEFILAKRLSKESNIEKLLVKLDSKSKRLEKLAKQKLIASQNLTLARLKKELARSDSENKILNLLDLLANKKFKGSKEVLLNYLYQPQPKIYLRAMKHLANDATCTKDLITFALSKNLSKKELTTAFKNLNSVVIKKLLLLLTNDKQKQQELIVVILKTQACQKIINILEEIFTPAMDLTKLWQVISTCHSKSQKLSNQLIDLIFTTEKMWSRYYALKILSKLHPCNKSLIPILKILKDDQQDFVSLEARRILKEIR